MGISTGTPTPNALAAVTKMICVIYCRISKDPTGRRVGVDTQREENLALAAELGWEVHSVLVDNDISAYSGKHRPDYHALMDLMRTGEVQRVIAWHPDRLHRSNSELEDYIDVAWKHNVPLQTKTGGYYDLSTSDARFKLRIEATVSSRESEHRSERVAAIKVGTAKAGKWNGGPRPFGYDIDKDKHNRENVNGGLVIRESEAEVIRDLASKLQRGVSLRQMSRELNERQIPMARGGVKVTSTGRALLGYWTPQNLGQLLLRPVAAGLRAHGPTTLYPAMWEPILERGTWEAIRAILLNPSRRSTEADYAKGPTPKQLGTGVYICGECKKRCLRSGSGGKQRGTYICTFKAHICRRINTIDAYVEGAIVGKLKESGVIEAAVAGAHAGEDVELSTLRAERDENEVTQEQLGKLLSAPGVAHSVILSTSTAIAALADRAATISRELAQAGQQSALAAFLGPNGKPVENIDAAWKAMSVGEQKAILNEVVDVTVNRATFKGRGPDGSYFDSGSIDLAFKI